MIDFRIGDIIEFKGAKEWDSYIDRITQINFMGHPDKPVSIEIWTQIYPEMAGCGPVDPKNVMRILERGKKALTPPPPSPYVIGDRVIFEEKENQECIDEIAQIEALFDGEWAWRCHVKKYGYMLDELEITEILPKKRDVKCKKSKTSFSPSRRQFLKDSL